MGVVIAVAGPLIGLARIGHLDLLRTLFGGVSLTPGVAAGIGLAAPCWLVPGFSGPRGFPSAAESRARSRRTAGMEAL